MTGWLPAPVEELFGPEATAEESYEVLTVDVPPASWIAALDTARTTLGCSYFDWLSAVDEPGTGFRVAAHVVALSPVRRLLVRTTVPHSAPVLASAVSVYAGAGWHERETHEMFGVTFEGHPGLDPLLLPEGFEGHPLRKDFVLAARVAKAWPGAKEPGESDHGGPKRRQMLPPGVPDPNDWGPLKGQLPPAPARPARGGARAAAGDRPVRRARTAGDGSASQAPTAGAGGSAAGAGAGAGPGPGVGAGTGAAVPPRRARSASQGSASQSSTGPAPEGRGSADEQTAVPDAEGRTAPAAPAGPRRARSAGQGSASQRSGETGETPAATPVSADGPTAPAAPSRPTAPRDSDAPWHHARPAFDEPKPEPQPGTQPQPRSEPPSEGTAEGTTEGTAEGTPEEALKSPTEPAGQTEPAGPTEGAPEATSKSTTGSTPESEAKPSAEAESAPDRAPGPDPAPTPDPAPEPTPGERQPDPDEPSGGTQ
ncbi:NADH-quinone oxidoreductase subunit C [Streptomyces sp. NBC_01571]|uniref:NADH-quinone oxidoreductase subunit C n=1 Tax=Streptomyces sp. NBC_01571 TaxID=2975883 RepID=UPI0022596238|nr:NADH-quinone oxidoreductase subunit C [Streptomyces sp. NBC_01571]MCX4576805.1 NADH-quinone oxidoreductase subunit C [Streptomyces sp. NBC_01571]